MIFALTDHTERPSILRTCPALAPNFPSSRYSGHLHSQDHGHCPSTLQPLPGHLCLPSSLNWTHLSSSTNWIRFPVGLSKDFPLKRPAPLPGDRADGRLSAAMAEVEAEGAESCEGISQWQFTSRERVGLGG